MKLNLTHPIIFIDLETTGLSITHDRIIEISLIRILPDGSEKSKTWRVNPEMPIDPKATATHGITDEDVKNEPIFKELAKTIAAELEGCDIGGYNLNKFDLPLLMEEFLRTDVDIDLRKKNIVDVQVIFHKIEQRTLSAAYKFYCGKALDHAHSAEADARATYEVLKSQLDMYDGMEVKDADGNVSKPVVNDMVELAKFTTFKKHADFVGRFIYDDKDRLVINFGKYNGKLLDEILEKDQGYYGWMMNADFPLYTKKILTDAQLKRKFKK